MSKKAQTNTSSQQEVPFNLVDKINLTQEVNNRLLETELDDAHVVELISIDDIYSESSHHNDSLVNALADSISHINLQNAIVITPNDIPGNEAKYRMVSGRKRYAAFLKLNRDAIPAHILTFSSDDSYQYLRKQLAEHEENLVRNQLSLLELCEHLGKCKEVYEEIYPETKHGGASKNRGKDPGTRTLPYALDASRKLGKSRATVSKLLKIYKELIVARPQVLDKLKRIEHPILDRVEDLSNLAKREDDIPEIVRIMCRYSGQYEGNFYSLHKSLVKLKQTREQEEQERQRKEELDRKIKEAKQRQAQNNGSSSDHNDNSDSQPQPNPTLDPDPESDSGSDPDNLTIEGLLNNATEVTDEIYEKVEELFQEEGGCTFAQFKEFMTLSFPDWYISCLQAVGDYDCRYDVEDGTNTLTFTVKFSGWVPPHELKDKLPQDCHGYGLYLNDNETCRQCPHNLGCFEHQIR